MQVAARIAIADDLGVVGAMAEAAIAELTPQRGERCGRKLRPEWHRSMQVFDTNSRIRMPS